MYMPLMHSERLEVHEKAYPLFQSNADSQKEDPEFYKFLQRAVMFEVCHDYKLDTMTNFSNILRIKGHNMLHNS